MSLKLASYSSYQTNVLLILGVFTFYVRCNKKLPELIYILDWTSTQEWAYFYLGIGQKAFIAGNCRFQNCFITSNRSYFSNLLDFDVLMFSVVDMKLNINQTTLIRSPSQLYILVGLEPAFHYPVYEDFNGIFNMTLTYKLTSNIVYPYIVVRNKRGEVIGPRKDMHWEHDVKDMAPTNKDTTYKLQSKSIAAAVVLSHCYSENNRTELIKSLKEELLLYGQKLDIYGNCPFANLSCARVPGERNGLITNCVSEIEEKYYFYLAYENSNSEDYVSEKVLHALNHFAVPVVYGGANYTRFMPDGIYLNARTLGVKKLAEKINSIINNPQRYIDFFKWHGYYTFYDTLGLETNDSYFICNICTKLNKRIQGKQISVYTNITDWWNDAMEEEKHTTEPILYSVLSILNDIMFKT